MKRDFLSASISEFRNTAPDLDRARWRYYDWDNIKYYCNSSMTMRSTKNVSITVPPTLLKEAEAVAKREGRTKSELFREALRRYVTQSQYRELQQFGRKQARKLGWRAADVERLVQESRREPRAAASVRAKKR